MYDGKKSIPLVLIGGDFNLPGIDWDKYTNVDGKHSNVKDFFFDLLDDYGLSQLVNFVTRPASEAILDLVLTSNPNLLTNISSSSGISDHDIVSFDLSVSPKIHRKPPRKLWQYRKSETKSLEKYLTEFTETFILEAPSRSVEENWDTFKSTLRHGMEIPTKMTKNKTSLPWITHNIKKEMRKKEKLHKLANKTHRNRLLEAYKKQRTKVNKLIRQPHNITLTIL